MSIELSEKDTKVLNEGRVLRAEATLLPLLQTKQALAVGRLIAAFRAGETNFIGHAAELSMIDSMRNEINQKIKAAEAIERKLYE